MEEIIESIGGFKNYDDAKLSGEKIHLYPNVRKESVIRVVVGNSTGSTVRSRVSSLKSFRLVYKDSEPDLKALNSLVSEMLNYDFESTFERYELKDSVLSISDLNRILESVIYNKNFRIPLIRSFGLYKPISASIRSIFMLYKEHIEELLLKFDTGLSKINKSKKQIPDLLENWRLLNKKYKIGSSSKLLLFMFPPKSPAQLPNLAHKYTNQVLWHPDVKIYDWDTTDKKLEKLISTFRSEITKRKFLYLGFCPKRPIYRIRELLKFPTDSLIACLEYMEIDIKDYKKIHDELKKIKLPKPVNPKFEPVSKPELETSNKLELLYNNLENWVELCKKNMQPLAQLEKYYVSLADQFILTGSHIKKFVYRI